MKLSRNRPTAKGPAQWFTGDVYIDPIGRGPEPSAVQIGLVHFTPGARSAWHAHGRGQTLWVTEGVGRVQSRGESVLEIRAGDVVSAAPGEEHWHGAAPDQLMIHVSITENVPDRPDVWGEHVTEDEYGARPSD